MNELERRLVDLGSALEVPGTPDLMTEVLERLGPRPRRARLLVLLPDRRRAAAAGLALALAMAGTAAAVPPVRHAIEQVIGLRGAVVERVSHLPPLPANAGHRLDLGRRIPVASARRAASFRALLPPRGVDAAYVSADVPGDRITLVLGRSLLMEFKGQAWPYLGKVIGPATQADHVRVGRDRGVYLHAAPHEMFFSDAHGNVRIDSIRLAGDVLLWQRGPLILRIEGASSRADALALARSLS